MSPVTFANQQELSDWLKDNWSSEKELWVRMYKKGSGVASVNWDDCVLVALCWGWIDGQRKALDEISFLQRLTPRRAKSSWSQRNCKLAEQLIAAGRMQPSGLAQVEAARADGRFQQAYAGSAEMEIPADFLKALRANAAAARFYETLPRSSLFTIYHRLHSAKRAETRARRIAALVERLAQELRP